MSSDEETYSIFKTVKKGCLLNKFGVSLLAKNPAGAYNQLANKGGLFEKGAVFLFQFCLKNK
jgi:hypothetical protein